MCSPLAHYEMQHCIEKYYIRSPIVGRNIMPTRSCRKSWLEGPSLGFEPQLSGLGLKQVSDSSLASGMLEGQGGKTRPTPCWQKAELFAQASRPPKRVWTGCTIMATQMQATFIWRHAARAKPFIEKDQRSFMTAWLGLAMRLSVTWKFRSRTLRNSERIYKRAPYF